MGTGRQEGVGVIVFFYFKGGWTDDNICSTLGSSEQVGVKKNKTLNCL